jgi:hypothetical protein
MRLVAISNRTLSETVKAYREAGVEDETVDLWSSLKSPSHAVNMPSQLIRCCSLADGIEADRGGGDIELARMLYEGDRTPGMLFDDAELDLLSARF